MPRVLEKISEIVIQEVRRLSWIARSEQKKLKSIIEETTRCLKLNVKWGLELIAVRVSIYFKNHNWG